ncbi:hypothetical protein CH063_05468 [Colletotrichum higginsianum]|uniref:Uncharacterized protein n=1 Tax=Colletotrichum higginsianum (strain IMI 349063) TaxID=759273 RepID=H1UZ41_COLHI|nr:hypothetical protein CH63R_03065 [Colletotrichum higginsianum IMI 349063]OBR14339.1 hypothetical protein CH63R_03065 [Colletotrichum higginsianum IMI 349063]CCF33242.1 hypothetical protein CH063_05468 [Colletotrichum higginsianum]
MQVTPENYVRAIISLSRRYSSTSAFPGNNYVDLGEWLLQVLQDRSLLCPGEQSEDATLSASASEQTHVLVVMYNSSERNWGMQQYCHEQHAKFYAAPSAPVRGSGQLVFIRGFISPSWVSVIGSKYNIDPEFFKRHMDFLSASIDRHAYSFPSLTSSSDKIFRLCVSTLFHRDDFGGQDLQSQRAHQAKELVAYRVQQLGSNKVGCGDSLVREYSTICSRFSVIEQWISLCITKTDAGWAVIVWMDQGKPLEDSPPGPWTLHLESKATPLPVLQYHHKMAFRNTKNRLDPGANTSAEVPQSTTVLPLQYESVLALVDLARHAPQDPLSMCIPLFAHAAFSEVQFLNLMESRVQMQMNSMDERVSTDALSTFQYFSNILNRHAQQLKDSTRALRKLAERSNQGSHEVKSESSMPKSKTARNLGRSQSRHSSDNETAKIVGPSNVDGAFSPKGLLEDYEDLYARCIDLSTMCDRGITLAMGKASVEESSKAIEQSQRLKKLTLLATLFIPLSFSTSVFGMNIDLLQQSTVRFWWFFILCVPITAFAYIFYLWDFDALRRFLARLWKQCFSFRRSMMAGTGEKDPVYIV